MAHAFVTKSQENAVTGAPETHTHTPASDASVIILSIVVAGTTARQGGAPTIGGVAATQAGTTQSSGEHQVEVWYRCAAYASGVGVDISIPNTVSAKTLHLEVVSAYAGVGYGSVYNDSSVVAYTAGTEDAGSLAVDTAAVGDFTYWRMVNGEAATASVTPTYSAATYAVTYANDHGAYTSYGYYQIADTVGTETMSWEWSNDVAAIVAVSFKSAVVIAEYTVTTLQGIHQHIAHKGTAKLSYLYNRIKHAIHQRITPIISTSVRGTNNFSNDTNCVAFYRFESGALTTDSKDSNTLSTSGTSPTASTSRVEGAYSGSFANNGCFYRSDANLSSDFPFKYGTSNNKISVSAWIRPNGTANYDAVWDKRYWTGSASQRVIQLFLNDTNYLYLSIGYDTSLEETVVTHGTQLSAGTWYHVTATYDASTKEGWIRLRNLSGDTVGTDLSGIATNTIQVIENAEFFIGGFDGSTPYYWDGYIDELAVFNDIITETEATSIAKGQYSPVSVLSVLHGIHQHILSKSVLIFTYLYSKVNHGIHQGIGTIPRVTLTYLWLKLKGTIHQHIGSSSKLTITYLFTKPFQAIHQHISQIVEVIIQIGAQEYTVTLLHGIHQHITVPIKTSLAIISYVKQSIHQHVATKSNLVLTYVWTKIKHGIHQDIASKPRIFIYYLWAGVKHGIHQDISPKVKLTITYLFTRSFQAITQHIAQPIKIRLAFVSTVRHGLHQHIASKSSLLLTYIWTKVNHGIHQGIGAISRLTLTYLWLKLKDAIHQHISPIMSVTVFGAVIVAVLHGIHQHLVSKPLLVCTYLYSKINHGIHQTVSPIGEIWKSFVATINHGIHQHIASRSLLAITYLWTRPYHAIHQHITVPAKLTLTYLWTMINHGIGQHIVPRVNISLTYLFTKPYQTIHQHIAQIVSIDAAGAIILAIKQAIHLHITPIITGSFAKFSFAVKHGIHQHITSKITGSFATFSFAVKHGIHQQIAPKVRIAITYLWSNPRHVIHQHIAQRVGNISWHDPSSITLTKGAVVSGRLHDVYRGSDATQFVLSEVLGAYVNPTTGGGFTYDFEFGQFEDVIVLFLDLCITGYYKGNPAHVIKLQQYNYDSTTWINVTAAASDFISASSTQYYTFHLINSANYISSGNIKLRVIHSSNGVNSHFLYLDKFYIRAGTTVPLHSIHQHLASKSAITLTRLWVNMIDGISQHIGTKSIPVFTYLFVKAVDSIHQHIANIVVPNVVSAFLVMVKHGIHYSISVKGGWVYFAGLINFVTRSLAYFLKSDSSSSSMFTSVAYEYYFVLDSMTNRFVGTKNDHYFITRQD